MPRAPGAPWVAGPFPFSAQGVTADREGRASYFDRRACNALYGSESKPLRWHRGYEEPVLRSGSRLIAAELLRFGESALLLVHLELPDSQELVDSLFELTRLHDQPYNREPESGNGQQATTGAWLNSLLDSGFKVAASCKRATSVTFVTSGRSELPRLFPAERYAEWPVEDQWLWAVASATPLNRFPPDGATRELLQRARLHPSDDWQALVLRDGAGFLGVRQDQGESDPYFRHAALYVRSLYMDALAAGLIQRLYLNALADDVAEQEDPVGDPAALAGFETRLAHYRNTYWWKHLTSHWIANELLCEYQAQHRLDDQLNQVVDELSDFSRLAQTLAAERTNALLGIVAVVGLPLGLSVGLFQVFEESSAALVWGVLGIVLGLSLMFLRIATPQWWRALGARSKRN